MTHSTQSISLSLRLAAVLLLSQVLVLATLAADSTARQGGVPARARKATAPRSPDRPDRPGRPGQPGLPLQGRKAVFRDDFDSLQVGRGRRWGWQTGAYARCNTNPGGHKSDHLSTSALAVRNGVLTITANRRSDGRWNTGLLTTGDSCDTGGNGFTERAGDLIVARVRLPEQVAGGWPGIWSWRSGGREIDLFEWHADAPGRLELVNHHRNAGKYWHDPLIRPGSWVCLGVLLGENNSVWYAGSTPQSMRAVWSDGKGVGRDFAAHPVVNLSVDDGSIHPRPSTRTSVLRFDVDFFAVYRRR